MDLDLSPEDHAFREQICAFVAEAGRLFGAAAHHLTRYAATQRMNGQREFWNTRALVSAASRYPTRGASAPLEFKNHQANQGEAQNGKYNIDRAHFFVLRLLTAPRRIYRISN
jgi:hypothetical protein